MHDDVYQMYLEEIKRIPPCTAKEEEMLLGLVKSGDKAARERLLEGMLHYVVKLAGGFRNQGLPAGDLVQEANMALLLALDQYENGNFREQVKDLVEENLNAAIEMQKKEKQNKKTSIFFDL